MKRSPRSTRREFIKGKSVVDAVENMLPNDTSGGPSDHRFNADPGSRSTSASGDLFLLEVSRRAMACEFQILVNSGQHRGAAESAMRALDLIESLEDQMTVYRAHSEVSQINQTAARSPVRVESRLFDLLRRAFALSESTHGAFDITAGPLVKAWGFYRREGRFPTESEILVAKKCVGYHHLKFDSQNRTIGFAQSGMEINLGAIGKGFALDRCASLLNADGVDNFMLHGGKSSVLACGDRASGESRGRGWSVGLRHPLVPEKRLAVIWLRDRAMGTSGDANQFFYHQGKRYGHVIDPRTGFPSQGVLSATVIASNAADADALATALFAMHRDEAIEYCRTHHQIGAVLVTPGQRSGETELTVVGLDSSSIEFDERLSRIERL